MNISIFRFKKNITLKKINKRVEIAMSINFSYKESPREK